MTFEMYLRDARRQSRAEGRAEGQQAERWDMLRQMLKTMSIVDVARVTGISQEEIERIVKS
ncbi:hypothetical protein [uncultured Flavonifractor sp.]|uniref:hypothetical protein n=1 Tax=uncultured Flavonifractor sp. TaxID=1193534 RepID=UPI0025913991|nr:hypothetical protein [uncultured Flavonifractor sp.]